MAVRSSHRTFVGGASRPRRTALRQSMAGASRPSPASGHGRFGFRGLGASRLGVGGGFSLGGRFGRLGSMTAPGSMFGGLGRMAAPGGVSQLTLLDMKVHVFFDRPEVKRALDRATRESLEGAAREIRYRSRASMKLAPLGVASSPGTPPHWHRRSKQNPSGGGLRKSIMYAFDLRTRSAVVGPSTIVGMNIANVAQRHEFARSAYVSRNPRRRKRTLGGVGEVRIGSEGRRRSLGASGRKWAKIAPATKLGRVEVSYGRLHSQAMVERANRLNEQLYGAWNYVANYPERKFMKPAMDATPIASFWRGSVRAGP